MRIPLIILGLCLSLPPLLSPQLNAVEKSGNLKMAGTYVWSNQPKNPGTVAATLVKTKDGHYDVSFDFDFRKKKHTYSGTCSSDTKTNILGGEVQNKQKKRTFSFTGTLINGVFTGTHKEGKRNTGTISMKVVKESVK